MCTHLMTRIKIAISELNQSMLGMRQDTPETLGDIIFSGQYVPISLRLFCHWRPLKRGDKHETTYHYWSICSGLHTQ